MNKTLLYPGIIFTIKFLIMHIYLYKINTNKHNILKIEQIIGDSNENTLKRSLLSSIAHRDFKHLITNIFSFIVISILLTDLTHFYVPIIIFYITIILNHILILLLNDNIPKSRVLGASGGIWGLYIFYVCIFLILKKQKTTLPLSIHKIMSIIIILFVCKELYKFLNKNKYKNNISYISHILGILSGFISYYILII